MKAIDWPYHHLEIRSSLMQPCQTARIMALIHVSPASNETGPYTAAATPGFGRELTFPSSHPSNMGFGAVLGSPQKPGRIVGPKGCRSTDISELWASISTRASQLRHLGKATSTTGRCSSWCWPRTELEKVSWGSWYLIVHWGNVMGYVIQSSTAKPSRLSADFQEDSRNAEPALLGHQQWGWSSHPQLLHIKEFKVKRDHQLSFSNLSCNTCCSVVLSHGPQDVFR